MAMKKCPFGDFPSGAIVIMFSSRQCSRAGWTYLIEG